MRYVDLGVSPNISLGRKRKRRKKYILLGVGVFVASLVAVVGYAFFWPILELLKNPDAVLSFFKNPATELRSTNGKTNFLLLGIDKRANVPYTFVGSGGRQERNGFLSDTILLASFDHNTKKVSLISVPRDTWVSLPAWDNFPATQGKINSTYSIGDVFDYPGGGAQLAKKVVGDYLGVEVHYVGRIDFQGFEKIIDTLGGIDVVVDKTFDDYRYPAPGKERSQCLGGGDYCRFEQLHFEAGVAEMDGKTALGFVRSRSGTNGEGSDFARAKRQQKIVAAVLKKALSLENILNPLTLNNLFKELGDSIETDFDLAAIPQGVKLARELNLSETETFVLDPESGLMVVPSPSLYGGAYVIIPKNNDWSIVKTKIKEFLATKQTSDQKEEK